MINLYPRVFAFYLIFQSAFINYATGIPEIKPQPKITIVGAGLAGLTAAHRLQSNGFEIEVFEARNRPGGRVLTAYFQDSYDELGGKNIDDAEEQEDLLSLIEECGLEVEAHSFKGDVSAIFNGEICPYQSFIGNAPLPIEETYNFLKSRVTFSNTLADLIEPLFNNNPEFKKIIYLHMSAWEGSAPELLSPHYLDISFWNIYRNVHEISRNLNQFGSIEIPICSVKGGNSQLIQALANSLKNSIHYNMPLRKLTQDGEKIGLHFEDGEVIFTDYLILALPCSTLRHVNIQAGIIPDDQMKAIETLQYGTVAKVLLPINFLNPSTLVRGLSNDLICWTNSNKKIMTWYLVNDAGVFNSNSVDEVSKNINHYLPSIQQLYPTVDFLHVDEPTIIEEEMMVPYEHPIAISWTNEEYSRGSYSNYSPEQFDLFAEKTIDFDEPVRKVFRSVNGQIFFAGEHTAIDDPATLAGAVSSGETAARMLMKAVR